MHHRVEIDAPERSPVERASTYHASSARAGAFRTEDWRVAPEIPDRRFDDAVTSRRVMDYIQRMWKSFVIAMTFGLLAGCGEPEPTNDSPDAPLAIDAPIVIDAPPTGGGTLTGMVSRSAQPMGDARGHVFVALFDRDPVVNMSSAQVVARVRIENVDLSASGASTPYTLTNIAPRAADYFLLAFLDDNGNVDPTTMAAGPDRGDLVSLDGFAAPKVKVTVAASKTENIILNSVLPF